MDGLLEIVPERFETARLVVRCPRGADAPNLNAAVHESLDDLRRYMPWAQTLPSLSQSEADCRKMQARFLLREELPMFMFTRCPDGSEGTFVGGTGLHRIDWAVRRFELGYWCRTALQGQGYIGEATRALTDLAFEQLGARRVELRTDDTNDRSRRVAERAGFLLEGVLRSQSLTPRNELRDTRVYARVAAGGRILPAGPVA